MIVNYMHWRVIIIPFRTTSQIISQMELCYVNLMDKMVYDYKRVIKRLGCMTKTGLGQIVRVRH